jgi:hypothetical protein
VISWSTGILLSGDGQHSIVAKDTRRLPVVPAAIGDGRRPDLDAVVVPSFDWYLAGRHPRLR